MKRIVWFVVGTFTGAVATLAGRRRINRRLRRVSSVTAIRDSAVRVRSRVADAVDEGRRATAEREMSLHERFGTRPNRGSVSARPHRPR